MIRITLVILLFLPIFGFSQNNDEFISWDSLQTNQESAVDNNTVVISQENTKTEDEYSFEISGESLALIALSLTILSAFFVHSRNVLRYRVFFLIISLIFFGFYASGCPCPVCGVTNFTLTVIGASELHASGYWFLALLPITFVFGKTWCGWVCHLGALQEFLFRKGTFAFLTSSNAQRTLSYIRYILFVLLVVQVVITHTNLWKEIDPFRVAFSLIGTNTISYILLVLLIVSSILVYRPFCRAICPLGLFLSWVSAIPGAMRIKQGSQKCGACKTCNNSCNYGVITRIDNRSRCNEKECIVCGECATACKREIIEFNR